jgi:predicted nucleotidyltransferase
MVRSFAEASSTVSKTIGNKYPQIKRAFIFGSFADESQADSSDVDILVELDSPMGLQYVSMIQDLEDMLGTSVDVITTKQAEKLDTRFGYKILSKARMVYERATS